MANCSFSVSFARSTMPQHSLAIKRAHTCKKLDQARHHNVTLVPPQTARLTRATQANGFLGRGGNLEGTSQPDAHGTDGFVRHFRSAARYIALHRDSTFVVVLPGTVIQDKDAVPGIRSSRGRTLDVEVSLVDDIAMLHGMGIRLVLVLGAQPQIDRYILAQTGRPATFASGYRITDEMAMEAAMEAAGSNRVLFEALLSKGPSVPMVRRHARNDREFHYSAAMNVVSGNYVAARRFGVVDGVDYRYTGSVRFVHSQAIQEQLKTKNVVLLSNLGYSAGGELLNCNTFDVAVRAAIEINADKMICMHMEEVAALGLPEWLSVTAAQALLQSLDPDWYGGGARGGGTGKPAFLDSTDSESEVAQNVQNFQNGGSSAMETSAGGGDNAESESVSTLRAVRITRGALKGQTVEMRDGSDTEGSLYSSNISNNSGGPPQKRFGDVGGPGPQKSGYWGQFQSKPTKIPPAVVASFEACRGGVTRSHLVDARINGGLLLELYSRDGVGTMISADFYEGIRRAGALDVAAVKDLLSPLEEAGIVVSRSQAALTAEIDSFVVLERESRVLACAQLRSLGASESGEFDRVAEIAAFCVHPEFRGTGRGDSLLDWIEQDARCRGFDLIVLLTTRTADWFQAREFVPVGAAHNSTMLPVLRRSRVDPKRNSQLYVKKLEAPIPGMMPGTRIGF